MNSFTFTRSRIWPLLSTAALSLILLAFGMVSLAAADESPQPTYGDDQSANWEDGRYALFFQTTGHSGGCNDGNWLTCAPGVNGDHFYHITLPCDWPAAQDFHIDILSPYYTAADQDGTTTLKSLDENTGGTTPPTETTFAIYDSGTYTLDMFNTPQLVTTTAPLQITAYPQETTRNHEWVRFHTIAGADVASMCGTIMLHEIVSWNTDVRNGWALRTGYDNDADPTNPPPADFANPGGTTSGTPIFPIGFEPETGGPRDAVANGTFCTKFFYDASGTRPAVSFFFFDLDFTAVATYTAPDGTQYPNLSIQNPSGWNGSGASTATDVATVLNSEWDGVGPEPPIGHHFTNPPGGGLWQIDACFSSEDHFYFSGPFGEPIYNSSCCTPTAVTVQTVEAEAASTNHVLILSMTLLLILTAAVWRWQERPLFVKKRMSDKR